MALQMVTANRLGDGAVVYLAADGSWCERLGDGCAAEDAERAKALLAEGEAAAAAAEVVGPYLIEVTGAAGAFQPVRLREAIRARGPGDHPELGKQAEGRV